MLAKSAFSQDDTLTSSHVISFILKDKTTILGYPNIKDDTLAYTYSYHLDTIYTNHDYGQVPRRHEHLFYYYDVQGKAHEILSSKIESISVSDNSFHFVHISYEPYGSVFYNQIVETDQYILYDGGAYFKIYNKQKKAYVKLDGSYDARHSYPGRSGLNSDIQSVEKYLKPFFSDCSDFLKKVQDNLVIKKYNDKNQMISTGGRLFNGIANFQCKNATLIKSKLTIVSKDYEDYEDYPNAVYLELLGNGLPYSINYERRFYGSGNVKLYGRGGLGVIGYSSLWAVWFPIECSVAFGNKNNFETGIGCTFIFNSGDGFDSARIPLRIGYRLEIDEFLFRFGLTPFFDNRSFFPMLGISFGKRFDD